MVWVLSLFLIFCSIHPSLSYVPQKCRQYQHNLKSVTDYDFQPYVVCNAQFGKLYSYTLNNETEYIFVFTKNGVVEEPPRVTVHSPEAEVPNPLLVVLTQSRSILSWQIPLIHEEPSGVYKYYKVSRTLCPDVTNGDLVITISTRGIQNISFTLQADIVKNFDIEVFQEYSLTVSPAEPQIFRFQFDQNASSALLHVESADDNCMSLSIQNVSCPVYDLEETIQFRGLWQTVMHKGGIFLRREEFPLGMYVVFVVHSTQKACIGKMSVVGNIDKSLVFKLESSIDNWDYIVAVSTVMVAFLTVYLIALCCVLCSRRKQVPGPSAESPDPFSYSGLGSSCVNTPTTPMSHGGFTDGSDDLETEVDWLVDATTSLEVVRTKPFLFLSDLAQKDPRILSAKSNLYLWNMSTVAVFYALPVVQLVFTYQQALMRSGNQDLCYYNFLCSHRLGFISDFNHVFSNIGYLLFGFLFLILTYRRQRLCYSVGHHLGIPYSYGMFYALGVALCMEGLLSASYHLCPNHSNFQFDTSFMYVLSMLSMIKIFQTRHPDITASAYTTFGILALVIFLGMFGVLNGSSWFYVLFTIVHLTACLAVTAQIYHVGLWKLDFMMFNRLINTFITDYYAGGIIHCLKPLYPARMILLFLANVGNWALVATAYFLHFGDFATYMLFLFLANLFMYFMFYIIMKVVSKEKILCPAITYIVLSYVFWGAAFYFFYHKSISWKLTPAQSRAYNQPCELLNFYDKHDIWHFLSAGGMFFSFMVLLTLDDDIAEKDRSEIPVF